MRLEELRKKSREELTKLLSQARRELVAKRMELQQGKLEDTSSLRKTRRRIAQILTIIREKEILEDAA